MNAIKTAQTYFRKGSKFQMFSDQTELLFGLLLRCTSWTLLNKFVMTNLHKLHAHLLTVVNILQYISQVFLCSQDPSELHSAT